MAGVGILREVTAGPEQNDKAVFHEEQRLSAWFLALVIAPTAGPLVGVFGYGMVRQLILGHPWRTGDIHAGMSPALPADWYGVPRYRYQIS